MEQADRESLWGKVDGYRVDLEPVIENVFCYWGSIAVAQTRYAVEVLETRHRSVIYVPMVDIRQEYLEPSVHETFCPFKGVASYWSLKDGNRILADVLWSYERPFAEVSGLLNYGAFYSDRIDVEKVA